MKTSLFLTTALTALLVTGAASAAKTTYVADLAGDDDNLATKTEEAATAHAVLTYDDTAKTLCGTIHFTTATYKSTASHVHLKEDKKVVVATSEAETTGDIKVKVTDLSATDMEDLAKPTYLAVHSETYADGAMAGDLTVDDAADEQTCDDAGGDDAGASSSSSSGATGSGSDAGKTSSSSSSSGSTASSTDDGGGCNTSGTTPGSALAAFAGIGIALAAASRKRKKA